MPGWMNAWGDDPPPEDQPQDPPPDDGDRYIDNPPHDSADDPWYLPRWGDAPDGTNDSGPSNPYSQSPLLPNYDSQGAQDQYTNYPGDIGGGKQPMVPFDQGSYQSGSGQDSERNAGTTFAASSFDYDPSAPQANPVLPVNPLQDYHDQLMDEIVNGNLNATLADDGSMTVTPAQSPQQNTNTADVPFDPSTAEASSPEAQVPPDGSDPYEQAAAALIKSYQPKPSLVPTDQDMNTPGVTFPNTPIGKLQQTRFNAADPTAGNVAQDAATKLLEAAAVSLPVIALSEMSINPAFNVVSPEASLLGHTFSVSSNGLAKWAADLAIRTGVGQVIGSKSANLPGPLPNILPLLAYTVSGPSGFGRAIENAEILGLAQYAIDKTPIPTGPSVPIFGNARDFLTMFLVGGLKGRFDEHLNAAQHAMKGLPQDILDAQTGVNLQNGYRAVVDAAPEDMVTVHHAVDPASVEDIRLHGLEAGESLYTDPEVAAAAAMSAGVERPEVLSYTVPRASLETSKAELNTLNNIEPLEANTTRVPDATNTVRTWLYTWTPNKNVASILSTGLREGSWLASSPEEATNLARIPNRVSQAILGKSVIPGTVLRVAADEGVVPTRTTLTREPAFRTTKEITNTGVESFQGADEAGIKTNMITPTDNLSSGNGWVGPDGQVYAIKGNAIHADTVKPGTFQEAGVDRALNQGWVRIGKDANGVYVHTTNMASVQRAVDAILPSMGRNANLDVELNLPNGKSTSFNGKMSDWLNSTPRIKGPNITLTGSSEAPKQFSADEVRTYFANASQDASALMGKLDGIKEQIQGGAKTPEIVKDYLETREDLLRSVTDVHDHGQDLADRTASQEGLPAAMRQAIKQFLADEEGSLRLPVLTPDGKYMLPTGSYPLTDTMLGTDPINSHLSKAQQMVNVAKGLTGKGVYNDPLAQGIRAFQLKARSVMSSMGANVRNGILARQDVFKFTKDGRVQLELAPVDVRAPQGRTEDLGITRIDAATRAQIQGGGLAAVTKPTRGVLAEDSGNTLSDVYEAPRSQKQILPPVHIQTIAADYAYWRPLLNDKQAAFMEWARDAIKPIAASYQELGLDPGMRPDIKPGGFYLPRDDAMTEAWAQDKGHTPTQKSRGVKPGSEKAIRFDSMEDAIAKGYTYTPFHEAMQNYIESSGRRLANQRVTSALKGALREDGTPLGQTPEAIVLSTDPALKERMDLLKGWVSSLTGSIQGLDQRSRDVMEKFVSTPSVNDADWEALTDTMDAMYTKGGTLRLRSSQGPAPDIRGNAKLLRQQIKDTLVQVRGQYKGLSIPEAKRLATQQTLDDLNITRGRFKGMDTETATNTLNAVKDTIKQIKPQYDASVREVRNNVGRSIKGPGFPVQVSDYQFPERFANDMTRMLSEDETKKGSIFSLTNNLLRAARLTGDLATITTHGTIALFNSLYNPVMAARVLKTTVQSTLDPAALGDFARDFDAKRAKDGNPNTAKWVQADSHFGEGEGSTRFVGLNRTYGAGTTAWRMELNNAAWDKSYNNLPPDQQIQKMREIAATNNLVTGYAPTSFGGPASSLALAPRLIQSQIDLLMHGLDPHGGIAGVGLARQKLVTYFGVAAALTVAANESGFFAPPPGFNYLSPTVNGKPNPDFMRIYAGGHVGKVSLLGAYDWMYKAVGAGSQGDLSYFPRTKAGPAASMAWDLISGRDFLGHPIGVNPLHPTKDFSPARIVPWLASSILPIAPSEGIAAAIRGQTGVGPKPDLTALGEQFLVSETGVKHTAPTATAEFTGLRDDTFQKLLKDGSIPPDVAALVKDTPYAELPLGLQKQIDAGIKSDSPEDYKWYHDQRLDQDNLFEEKKALADDQRTKYAAKFDDLNNDLKAGKDPYMIWNAYETDKNQRTGALASVYEDPAYRKAVANLPQSDMRRLESDYDNVLFGYKETPNADVKDITKFNNTDWDNVQQRQQEFMLDLQANHPDQAKLLQYSLDQRDKLGIDNASALEQLKKNANKTLEPYYQLVGEEKSGMAKAGVSQKWLTQNPDADYQHWLTEKPQTEGTVPKLHSPTAVAQAVAAFSGTPREIALVGSKQPIRPQDLQILRQYDKQITQIINSPGSAVDPETGKSYSPVQRLRQNDPTYDAIYTWLFAQAQKDTQGRQYVTTYHADYVNQFLQRVGGRVDKAKPRTIGNSSSTSGYN